MYIIVMLKLIKQFAVKTSYQPMKTTSEQMSNSICLQLQLPSQAVT